MDVCWVMNNKLRLQEKRLWLICHRTLGGEGGWGKGVGWALDPWGVSGGPWGEVRGVRGVWGWPEPCPYPPYGPYRGLLWTAMDCDGLLCNSVRCSHIIATSSCNKHGPFGNEPIAPEECPSEVCSLVTDLARDMLGLYYNYICIISALALVVLIHMVLPHFVIVGPRPN